MKNITKILFITLLGVFISSTSLFADSGTSTFTTSGYDNAATTLTVTLSDLAPIHGSTPIDSIKIINSAGSLASSYCGTWYDFDLKIDGASQFTHGCASDFNGYVIPNSFTNFEIISNDLDAYGDNVYITVDVIVYFSPTCPAPSNSITNNVSPTSAQFNWVSGGSSNYNVEYGITGFTQGTGNLVNVTTDTFLVVNSLTPETTYEWYVQDSCAVGDVSTWLSGQSFTTPPSCPAPTNLMVSAYTTTTATLNWISGGSSNYNVEYGVEGFTQGTGTVVAVTDTFALLTGLASGTEYDWYVQDSCGAGDASAWVSGSFTTVFTAPYFEDYTSYLPTAWTEKVGRLETNSSLTGTSSAWKTGNFANTGSNSAAKVNIYSTSKKEWLISPSIDLSSGGNNHLSFDIALTNYNSNATDSMGVDDTLAVVISTDNGLTWDKANIIKVWTATSVAPSNNGDNFIIDVSSYNTTVKFGFYAASTVSNTDYDMHIDNFKIYEPLLNDVSVSSIVSTHGGFEATTTDTLIVLVTNNGINAQTNIPVKYQLDNGTVISETMASLASLATDTFEFATTFDATIGGTHEIIAYTDLAGDQVNSNDTSSYTFDTEAQNDLGVIELITPENSICGDAASTVKVIVKNFGIASQASAPISVIITDPSGSSVTLSGNTATIASLATDTVSVGTVNTLSAGEYTVQAYTDLSTDTIFNDNDTLNTTFDIAEIYSVTYVDEFENTSSEWTRNGMFLSSSHGKTGQGLYKNFYSYAPTASAFLNHKIGSITANSKLVFDYRIKNYSGGTATVLDGDKFYFILSDDCGSTLDTVAVIDSSNHNATIDFTHKMIDLTSYVGQEVIIMVSGEWGAGDYYFSLDNFGIANPVAQIDLGVDTAICENSTLDLDATSDAGSTYLWTANNDTLAFTGAILTVDSAATYAVEINAPVGTVYDTIVVSLNTLPVVSFTGLDTTYCASEMPVMLVGAPVGGMFTGMGITGDSFDPFAAGAGNHAITYEFTDNNGCSNSSVESTVVEAAPVAVVSADSEICEGDSVVITSAPVISAPSVFFATYIEGSSNNKALEIYNGTSNTINLDNYRIAQASNGNGWSYYHTFPAGSTLAPNGSWIMVADQVSDVYYDTTLADEVLGYPSLVHFNGDDARAIEYTTDGGTTWMMVDIIGDPDNDPGSAWDVAGVTGATKDHSLNRKSTINGGSLDWTAIAGADALSSQYVVLPKNDFSTLGNHMVTPPTGMDDTYLWSTGDTTSEITVMPTMTTTYYVTVSNPNMDCDDIDSVTIVVNPLPVVDLGADQTIKWTAGSVNLDAGNAGATFLWSTGETSQIVVYDNTNLVLGANTISVTVDLNGCTAMDEVVITVMDDVSIGESFENASVSIYPNPTNGQFDMTVEGVNGNFNMQIVNVTGEVVYTEQMDAVAKITKSFDLSNFAAGVYYVKLSNNDGIVVKKLVVK